MLNRLSSKFPTFATALLVVAGCGSKVTSNADSPAGDSGAMSESGPMAESGSTFTTMGNCSWPASLDPPMGHPSEYCVAALALLYCSAPGGGGADCLSNDSSMCPWSSGSSSSGGGDSSGGSSASGGSSSGATETDSSTSEGGTICVNQCANGEYAVECFPPSAFGAGTAPSPPSTCRLVNGRSAFYCCPCGM